MRENNCRWLMALSPSGRRTRFWSSGVSSSGVQTNACSLLTFSQERSDLQQSVKSVSSVVEKVTIPEADVRAAMHLS